MLNNILINKLNNRGVILNNPRPKTSRGTKKWCRKRGKALNNKHPALNNRLNNILNNTATGLFNALNNKLINGAPRLFNMEELRGFVDRTPVWGEPQQTRSMSWPLVWAFGTTTPSPPKSQPTFVEPTSGPAGALSLPPLHWALFRIRGTIHLHPYPSRNSLQA